MLFTELRYLIAFRSYHNSKFVNLGLFLIKKTRKIEIWDILRKTYQLPQFKLDFDKIWTRDSLHVLDQFHVGIFENFENFRFGGTFLAKKCWISSFFTFFSCKISIKSEILKIFKNNNMELLQHMYWVFGPNFIKIGLELQ